MVVGYKINRKDSLYRIILSRWYNYLIRLMFRLKTNDINCGFRIIKKEVIDNVLKETKTFKKYCTFSEFTIRAYKKGYKIRELPIKHFRRIMGRKKSFFVWNIVWVSIVVLYDLLRLKYSLSKK